MEFVSLGASGSRKGVYTTIVKFKSMWCNSSGCTLFDLIEGLKGAVYSLIDEFSFTFRVPIKGKMRFAFENAPLNTQVAHV